MIQIVYETFVIRTDGKTPGTYRVAKKDGKGSIPLALMGNYTSVGLAREDIDRYMARCNGVEYASKARTARRSK